MLFKISDKVIGYEEELSFFLRLYNNKYLPNTILLQGLEGIGKYTFVLHLINSLINNKNTFNLETSLMNNNNIFILKKNEESVEFKFEDVKKIINFCKYKSFDVKPKFVVIKSIDLLNKSSVNALLKLTEEVKENVYFFFTSNFMKNNSKTLESRFFKKKLFLNKKYFNQIISYFFKTNNINKDDFEKETNDTPGIYLRKYLLNLENNLEKIKKNDENIFYKIISEKIIEQFEGEHLEILKKIKFNLMLKNDMSKLLKKLV
tara:strand:- start:1721 stop:2503 length:783 start_codon:yes stop_codon:yes gene_type:complete